MSVFERVSQILSAQLLEEFKLLETSSFSSITLQGEHDDLVFLQHLLIDDIEITLDLPIVEEMRFLAHRDDYEEDDYFTLLSTELASEQIDQEEALDELIDFISAFAMSVMADSIKKACLEVGSEDITAELIWTDNDPIDLDEASEAIDEFFEDTALSEDAQEQLRNRFL
ncbi:MAG: hypothetical protein MI867_29030 [Pseudomonadales bacterium]|nr:hypothetical protein [Pseudomonadales bacterium]